MSALCHLGVVTVSAYCCLPMARYFQFVRRLFQFLFKGGECGDEVEKDCWETATLSGELLRPGL